MTKLLISTLLVAVAAGAAETNFSKWMGNQELKNGTTLTLPKGVHHALPDNYPHRYLHISNNDDGIKHIVFDLSGLENVTIDGTGAEAATTGCGVGSPAGGTSKTRLSADAP